MDAAYEKSDKKSRAYSGKGSSTESMEEEVELDQIEVFTIAEEMPSFPGEKGDLEKFIVSNIIYPEDAKENGISGKVFVTFVVNKTGEISDIRILKGIGYGCDEAVIELIESMPKWNPGKQRNKPVSVQYNLPVEFKLTE